MGLGGLELFIFIPIMIQHSISVVHCYGDTEYILMGPPLSVVSAKDGE